MSPLRDNDMTSQHCKEAAPKGQPLGGGVLLIPLQAVHLKCCNHLKTSFVNSYPSIMALQIEIE